MDPLLRGVRFYEGPARPASDVAILVGEEYSSLKLMKIDGKARPIIAGTGWNYVGKNRNQDPDGGLLVELLPGEHTLEFKYSVRVPGYSRESSENQAVVFTAKPGTLYVASADLSPAPGINSDVTLWAARVRERGPIPVGFVRPTKVVAR